MQGFGFIHCYGALHYVLYGIRFQYKLIVFINFINNLLIDLLLCKKKKVHSRIRRVFFAMKHEKEYMGGLNQNLALNNCESLNHKFMVFSKVGLDYCMEKRKEIN